MVQELIARLIARYQKRAEDRAKSGRRPVMGACELARSGHCSALFLQDMSVHNAPIALGRYLGGCTRGPLVATKGLMFATGLALIPSVRWDPNEEPCFEGSPAECP